jgi:hypothetical protein
MHGYAGISDVADGIQGKLVTFLPSNTADREDFKWLRGWAVEGLRG